MRIRPGLAMDVAAIRRIHQGAIREICARDYAPEVIVAWLAGNRDARYLDGISRHSFWVVEQHHDLVAFGSVAIAACKLESLFVDPAATGGGIASRLLSHLEEVARAAGIAVLHLESSLTARNFYARFGYEAGSESTVIVLASGIELAGIPMSKRL